MHNPDILLRNAHNLYVRTVQHIIWRPLKDFPFSISQEYGMKQLM